MYVQRFIVRIKISPPEVILKARDFWALIFLFPNEDFVLRFGNVKVSRVNQVSFYWLPWEIWPKQKR